MRKRIIPLTWLLLTLSTHTMASDSETKLAPCPDTPNCVSSLEQGRDSYIEPLQYTGEPAVARAKLLRIIRQHARAEIIREEADYLHTTFSSRVFGFVDDVEFLFDDKEKLIHMRSASRKGKYDFGVNRRRMEALRGHFQEQ